MDFTSDDALEGLKKIGNKDFLIPKEGVMAEKRPYDRRNRYGEPPSKKPAPTIRIGGGFKWNLQALANAADAVESGGKSPVSALNELGVRVSYSVLRQGGPAHCPSFTIAVTVADMTFEGWGHSKREARAAAARACLAAFLARAGRVLPAPNQHQDFTADEAMFPEGSEFQCMDMRRSPETVSIPDLSQQINNTEAVSAATNPSPGATLFGTNAAPSTHKSPINVLYENYPGLTFACTFGDGSPLDSSQAPLQLAHSMRFKVVCQIKDQKFEGYGSSKKLAKLAAARSALAVLEERRVEPAHHQHARAGFLHQTLADHIANIINEKFSEMMKQDVVHSKRKALAGIVITINNKIEGAKVIAVTTGTKCVSGEHMSVRGRAVNDCHAEVAARRCLQRHLYAQLLMYASQPDPRVPLLQSDLEPVQGGGYQLKPNRQLHLYISTAPCGDGRIFSPHEQHEPEPDRHPNRLARGQLRTKIESGEGTIPVKNCSNLVQTWDGVMQGERLLTMSCSDKVARWCVVGLQGALLSRLIRPVYLHSLILGSLLHPHHMYRAICGRIEAYISSLPPPYRLHRPLLARAASTEARTPARAPSFSVCWCCTTPAPEVLNATTGKLENGQPSLLCKQSMFARWQYLVKRLPHAPQDVEDGPPPTQLPSNLDSVLYNEAKLLCPGYQAAKERLFQAFEKAKLGRWIKKPLEQDQFVCELLDADPKALFAWAGHFLPGCSAMQVGHCTVKELGQPSMDGDDDNLEAGKLGDDDNDVDRAVDNTAESDISKVGKGVEDSVLVNTCSIAGDVGEVTGAVNDASNCDKTPFRDNGINDFSLNVSKDSSDNADDIKSCVYSCDETSPLKDNAIDDCSLNVNRNCEENIHNASSIFSNDTVKDVSGVDVNYIKDCVSNICDETSPFRDNGIDDSSLNMVRNCEEDINIQSISSVDKVEAVKGVVANDIKDCVSSCDEAKTPFRANDTNLDIIRNCEEDYCAVKKDAEDRSVGLNRSELNIKINVSTMFDYVEHNIEIDAQKQNNNFNVINISIENKDYRAKLGSRRLIKLNLIVK